MSEDRFDYVIVGGGSAGCVLANRLSADPACRVLVLEAGRRERAWDVLVQMPGAAMLTMGNRLYDWDYRTEPEPHLDRRRIALARGKMLGGSSSINGMVFQRGNPLDYDAWADADPSLGQWDFAHCLPYFKRLERTSDGDPLFRGRTGPLHVERSPAANPLSRAFFLAAQQAGYELSDDFNGARQEGFGPMDRNVQRGRRFSAFRAYLEPVLGRPNLTVRTGAHVSRLLFEGQRAVGVEYLRRGRRFARVGAGEVILAGGAVNTPQVLQLSGVGDAAHLRSLGIDVVMDLPGVGENLQDHLEVYVQHASTQPVSLSPAMRWWNRPGIGARWLLSRSGLAASNHLEAGGFVRTNDSVTRPNLMFHFVPIAVDLDGKLAAPHGYQAHITPVLSDARGSVRIRSTDPRAHPALVFNYLSTEQDRREWIESVRITREILAQPAFAALDGGELQPGPEVQSDDEILAWVAARGETSLHASGTAKMGSDALAVVDPATMGVYGVEGLRVVDASVMPLITNGNTYAPVMMIAEKAADLISGATPAPPERVAFHVHPRAGTTP